MAQAMDDPTPMHELTAFQRDLLTAVRRLDGPNGLEVKAEMRDAYGSEINNGSLYPNLDTLADEGLLVKDESPKGNEYSLTNQAELEYAEDLDWRTRA